MANPEHVEVVRQGAKAIAAWRSAHRQRLDLSRAKLERLDLSSARLSRVALNGAKLKDADLRRADLTGTDLSRADLSGAVLSGANLHRADLSGANLNGAALNFADLSEAHLRGAKMMGAFLPGARLSMADLTEADLTNARLVEANLSGTRMTGAVLSGAILGWTVLAHVDLSKVDGLDRVEHELPSSIIYDTLARSRGKIPESFLRGCGLTDWEIVASKLYTPDLRPHEAAELTTRIYDLRMRGPIQLSPVFISYSHGDGAFVDELEGAFNQKHVRFWRDIHDMTAGRMEKQITRAISLNPTVVLILSQNSVKSDWVEWEASKARELEKELGRDVLCPVALDAAWKTCDWPGPLRRQIEDYNILDFSKWRDGRVFARQFDKLIKGLGLFYSEEEKS